MYLKIVILLESSFLILQSWALKNDTLEQNGRTEFICPSIGLHADLTNGCKSYHTCGRKNSTPTRTRNCPRAQIFDQFEKECLPKNEANCITCQDDGFFIDHRDHHYYFECKRGMAERHPCVPEGSTFNEKEQLCELDETKDASMFVKHPDSNPFGFNAQPNFMRAFEESKKKVWGADHELLKMKELTAQTVAKVGAAKASSSAASRGQKDAGVAHSQTFLGAPDDGAQQEVFKGLGSMGGEFSSIHAMATATGTKHVDEDPHEVSAEHHDQEPDFKLKEDTMQLGTKRRNKRQNAGFPQQDFGAAIREHANKMISQGFANSGIPGGSPYPPGFPFHAPPPGFHPIVQQAGNNGQDHRQHHGDFQHNIARTDHTIHPTPEYVAQKTSGQSGDLHKEVEGARSLNAGKKSNNDNGHSNAHDHEESEEEVFNKKTRKIREDKEEHSDEASETHSSASAHNEQSHHKHKSSHKQTKGDRSHHDSSEEHEEIHIEIEMRPKNRNQTTQSNGSVSSSAITSQIYSSSTQLPPANSIKVDSETTHNNGTKNADNYQNSTPPPHLAGSEVQPAPPKPKHPHSGGDNILPAKKSHPTSSNLTSSTHGTIKGGRGILQNSGNKGTTPAPLHTTRATTESTPPSAGLLVTKKRRRRIKVKRRRKIKKLICDNNITKIVKQPEPHPPATVPPMQVSPTEASSEHEMTTETALPLEEVHEKSSEEVQHVATSENVPKKKFALHTEQGPRWAESKAMAGSLSDAVGHGGGSAKDNNANSKTSADAFASPRKALGKASSNPSTDPLENGEPECSNPPCTLNSASADSEVKSSKTYKKKTRSVVDGESDTAPSGTSYDSDLFEPETETSNEEEHQTLEKERAIREVQEIYLRANGGRKRGRRGIQRGQMRSILKTTTTKPPKIALPISKKIVPQPEEIEPEPAEELSETQKNEDAKIMKPPEPTTTAKSTTTMSTTRATTQPTTTKLIPPSTTTPKLMTTSSTTSIKTTTAKPKKPKNKTSSSGKPESTRATAIPSPPQKSASKQSLPPPEVPKHPKSSPIQHHHDPFNLDIGSFHGFHDNDLFPISHSFDHHGTDFHTEWATGQEHSDSAHAHIPVAYEKTFGLSNSSSYKTSFTSDHHEEGSFISGTSETHHHEHSYATEKKKGAEKRMKSVKSRKEEKSASTYHAEDGSKKVFADSKLDHHENTNISEYDQHTMDSKVSYHHKKLEKYNSTDSDHDTNGSITTNFNGSTNGSEILRSKYIGQDAPIEENVDNKLHGIDILRSEKQGDNERRLLTSKLVSSNAGAKVMNDSGVVQLTSRAKSFTRDLQVNNVTAGVASQSMTMNNTYATDTSSQKNMTGEFETGIANQKSRASEAHMAISAIDGTSKITDVSTLVAGDTTSKTNKSANSEVISTLQTQTSMHTDRRGNVESMGDDQTRSNFNTRIDNDAKQTMTIVERTNDKKGRPKTEKVTERKKTQGEKRLEKSKKVTDLNTNISTKVETLASGNKSSSSTGSEVFYVLSPEGKRQEIIARAPSKHKRVRVDSEKKNKAEEPEKQFQLAECIICSAIQVVAQKKVVTTTEPYDYYSDEESSKNSSKQSEQSKGATRSTTKQGLLTSGKPSSSDEYYDDDETAKNGTNPKEPLVMTTTAKTASKSNDDEYSDKEDAAIAHAAAGRNDGEAVAIAASHSSGGLTEVGAVAAAGNGVARASASAKRFKPEEAKTKKEDDYEDG